MPRNDARKFVTKMREDSNFRKKALNAREPEDLETFLGAEGLIFNRSELVEAMAECMVQLEKQMEH